MPNDLKDSNVHLVMLDEARDRDFYAAVANHLVLPEKAFLVRGSELEEAINLVYSRDGEGGNILLNFSGEERGFGGFREFMLGPKDRYNPLGVARRVYRETRS
jgi:hypothetical protein